MSRVRRSWCRPVIAVAALVISCLGSLPAWAADFVPAGGEWRTLTTAHFWVHYPAELREVALKAAQYAEESHEVLGPLFRREDDRTHVTILDTEDTTNGFATPYPDSSLTFWVTPPSPEEDWYVGRYDNWLKMVIAHEYTHVLHLRSATGPGQINGWINASLLRFLFPEFAVLLQLDFLPNFLKEGLAVFQESALTGGGRALEGQFDMVLRRQFLEGAPFSIDKASGNYALEWAPGGALYSYGTIFHKYLSAKGGVEQAVRISDRLGEFPWGGINLASLRATGKPMYQLWDEAIAFFRERYETQVEAIRRRPVTTSRAVTTTGRNHRHPHWLDAETLLFTQSPLEGDAGVVRQHLPSGNQEFVLAKSSRKDFRIVPGGKGLVSYGTGENTRLTGFNDSFRHDFFESKSKPLTRGLRASCPAPHPDGRTLVVLNGGGRNDLGMLDPDGKLLWRLKGPMLGSFASPAWHPDGRRAVVVQWTEGRTNLVWLDAETRTLKPVAPDDAVQIAPSFSPDGKWLLFASDRTGVMNLHALRLADGARFQVTNVLGGAFDPEVSPDGRQLAYVDYGVAGYDIHVMPFLPAKFQPETRERGEGVFRKLAGDPAVVRPLRPATAASATVASPVLAEGDYNPLQSLQPRLVWPFAFFDHSNNTLLRDLRLPGGELGGFGSYMAVRGYGEDALRRHFWFASLGLTSSFVPDTPVTPFIQAAYQNDVLDPTLGLSYVQVSEPSLTVNGGRINQPLLLVDGQGGLLAQYQPNDLTTPTLYQVRTTHTLVGSVQLDPPPSPLINPWMDGLTTKFGVEWKRIGSSVMIASQSVPDAVLVEGRLNTTSGDAFAALVPVTTPPTDFYLARFNVMGNSAFRPGRPISTTDGTLWNVGLERTLPQLAAGAVSLGSTLGYSRAFADWRRYLPLPGRQVVAFRGFAGTLFDDRDDVPYALNNFGWYAADLGAGVTQDPNTNLLLGRATSTALFDLQDLRVLQDSPDRRLPLRGYGVRNETPVGRHAAMASLEWRVPLGELMAGPGTVPVFLERLSLAPFIDWARVWNVWAQSQDMVGAGLEFRTHVTLAQGIPSQFRLGYGRGFHPVLGGHQLILGIGANF